MYDFIALCPPGGAKERCRVPRDPAEGRLPIHGVDDGNLDNDGEQLRLRNVAGDILFDFTCNDIWYPETDNGGRSLVIADPYGPLAAWDTADGWQPSASTGGTPGTEDSRMTAFECLLVDLNP